MRISAGILFPLFFLFSCCKTESPPPARNAWTEKDVEGYWATSNLINASNQSQYFPDSIGIKSFLRFKNFVNGEVDSSFFVRGDTVWTKTLFLRSGKCPYDFCFEPGYKILFATKEKLILFDLKCRKEINYYNVMTLPETKSNYESLGLSEIRSSSGIEVNQDSFYVQGREFLTCSWGLTQEYGFSRLFDRGMSVALNPEYKDLLSKLVSRVDWSALTSQVYVKDEPLRSRIDSIVFYLDLSPDLWIKTGRKFYLFDIQTVRNNSAALALYVELEKLRIHADAARNGNKQRHVMPSQYNLWLLDTAAVRRDQEIRNRN